MTIKLPKQWKYWCRKANLRPEQSPYGGEGWCWMSLNGRGRKWRIALRDQTPFIQNDCVFMAGDTYEEFDRWALSNRLVFEIPKTWSEFQSIITQVDTWKRD